MSNTNSLSIAERIALAKAQGVVHPLAFAGNVSNSVHSAESADSIQPVHTANTPQPVSSAMDSIGNASNASNAIDSSVDSNASSAHATANTANTAPQPMPSVLDTLARLKALRKPISGSTGHSTVSSEIGQAIGQAVQPTVQAVQAAETLQPTVLSLKEKLAALQAKAKTQATQKAAYDMPAEQPTLPMQPIAQAVQTVFNTEQLQAIDLATQGNSFCLIGAAGTGKTTAVREIVRTVLANNPAILEANGHALESIALVSFTNRAVRNIKKAVRGISEAHLRERGASCCSTIHRLLGFKPVRYEVEVPNPKGYGYIMKRTVRFEPTYRIGFTLDHIKLVIIDEASMLGLKLFKQLVEACPNATFVFIGDLNQLKPVMDDSILGHKLRELPVVELTTVYRQALESPIVGFQHKYTLAGKQLGCTSLKQISAESNGMLHFQPILKPRTPEELARVFANAMLVHMDNGVYDPCKDIILLPNYKGFGSYWVSLWIAQELGRRRNAIVHEVQCTVHRISESSKRYLAVGDFVIHNKEEYFIADISCNAAYRGRSLQQPCVTMNRIGGKAKQGDDALQDFDELLYEVDAASEGKEVCSHFVTLVPSNGCSDLDEAQNSMDADSSSITLSTRNDVAELEFGYAITIHKSQGSEWRKVFLALSVHAKNMLTRELLYVGMTRAREELYIYYSPDSSIGASNNSVAKCIRSQEIKGNTWREKLQSFSVRREEYEAFMAVPTVYGVDVDE